MSAAGKLVGVGVGPGDPELITLKAVRVLERADVVVHFAKSGATGNARAIAQRSRRIALQSVLAGMTLSVAGMCAAAAGWLPPVAGAVAQEAIDLVVILNALRARAARPTTHRDPPSRVATAIPVPVSVG